VLRFTIIAFALTACGGDDPPPEPVAIGFLAPLTGDIAAFGRDLSDATNLALEEINNGGGVIDGREIRIIVHDTGTSPTGASIGYTALLNQTVPVVLGPVASSEAAAIREQVKASTTLTISQSATSPELSSLDFGGYFFRLAPSDVVQAVVLAEEIQDAGLANLCIVHRDDAYGNGLAEAVRTRIAAPTTQASFDPGLADLSSVLDPCDSLIAGPNTGILFITLVADGVQLIDDAATRGWSPANHRVFLTDGTKNRDLVTLLDNKAFVEGAVGTAATGPDPDSADGVVLRDFKSRFRSRFGRDSDVYAEMAYDALYVAAVALELAGTTDDRSTIRDAMANLASGESISPGDWAAMRDVLRRDGTIDFRGASGDVVFDLATGDITGPFFISVWTINNGVVTETEIRRIDSI
jgi:branched-chain amino acid transport system substrate-binding protein